MAAIGIVLGAVILFVIGFVSFGGAGFANTGNDNIEGCSKACANLVAKRAQTCGMRAAVAAAKAAWVAAGTLYAAAVAASVAAAAAAAAAVLIPIVGPIVAAGLAAVAAAAGIASIYQLGRFAAASLAYGLANDALADAMRLEGEAMTLVFNSCSNEVATACLASLPACAV